MNPTKTLVPLAFALLLAACGAAEPAADANADAAAATDAAATAATQTEAVYGDEAPVAIQAAPPADDHGHAHNADGSHAEGDEHAEDAHADDAHPDDHAH